MPQAEDAEQHESSVAAALHVHPDVRGASPLIADSLTSPSDAVQTVPEAQRDLPPASVEECAAGALPWMPLKRFRAAAVCVWSHGSPFLRE